MNLSGLLKYHSFNKYLLLACHILEGGNGQKVSLEIMVSSRSYSLIRERHIPENRKYKIVIEVEMNC